jgi:uncharacterized protein YjiS (DUF1127 family)
MLEKRGRRDGCQRTLRMSATDRLLRDLGISVAARFQSWPERF